MVLKFETRGTRESGGDADQATQMILDQIRKNDKLGLDRLGDRVLERINSAVSFTDKLDNVVAKHDELQNILATHTDLDGLEVARLSGN